MRVSIILFGGLIGIGMSSLVASRTAHAQEVIHYPNYQVTQQIRSTSGGGTAGPFVAASMMGAEGFSSVPAPSAADLPAAIGAIVAQCKVNTNALPQADRNTNPGGPLGSDSPWPSNCNPAGMAITLNAIPNPPAVPAGSPAPHWVRSTFATSDKQSALNTIYNAILFYHSPAIIPIYGVADHWMAIVDVRTTNNAVTHVRWIDSGPNDDTTTDGLGNTYLGTGITTPTNLSNQYYQVLTAINPACDTGGCTQDPYYNKFVLMYEPPLNDHRGLSAVGFAGAPGVAPTMNEQLAQRLVWTAITSGGVDGEPEVQQAKAHGVAGTAFLVHAVYPDGSPWNYYLVPILSKDDGRSAIAFVRLTASNGSFESINFPVNPAPFVTVAKTKAESLARELLSSGEQLAPAQLTWDPMITTKLLKSATRPYYEFDVVSAAAPDKVVGVIRVSLIDGSVERAD